MCACRLWQPAKKTSSSVLNHFGPGYMLFLFTKNVSLIQGIIKDHLDSFISAFWIVLLRKWGYNCIVTFCSYNWDRIQIEKQVALGENTNHRNVVKTNIQGGDPHM